MTTKNTFSDRNRDLNDGLERHIFEKMEPVEGGGHILKVKGTGGSNDQEVVYLNVGGIGIHLPANTDAEVHLLSSGSDTHLKFGIVAIPHDKERKWPEGANGIQHWNDAERFLEFGKDRAYLKDKAVAIGEGGVLEVKGGKLYIRGDLHISGEIRAGGDVHTPTIRATGSATPVAPVIPDFSEAATS